MPILKQVEDPISGAVLKTFLGPSGRAVMPVGQWGWERRNATFQMANISFGTSPFGNFPAPMQTRKFPWQVRVFREWGQSLDAARDALNKAVGQGFPVRLVTTHDDGYERICENAVAYTSPQPFSTDNWFFADYNVEWELNSHWTERAAVDNSLRMGQGYLMGQGHVMGEGANTVTISSNPFNLPTSMMDSSLPGPGGVANQADTGPIFTIVGPVGGSLGFTLQNLSDRYGAFFNFILPIGAGHVLTVDCGAWSAIFDGTADLAQYISVPTTQPYWMAIAPGVANQLRFTANGTSVTTGGTIQAVWRRYFL